MEMRFFVRRARPADLTQILAIERQGFGKWAWDRKLFAEYSHSCGELFLVVEVKTTVAGYCIGRLTGNRCDLESIAVSREARGSGAADALLRSLLRRCRLRHVDRVSLMVKETNRRAMRFYERYGFRRLRRVQGYYEDGRAGVLYRLDFGGPQA